MDSSGIVSKMKKENSRSHIILLVLYYLFMFVLQTPLLGSISVPPMPIRLGYLLLLVVPICRYDKSYLPIVVFAAYSISKFGTAITLMPTEIWFYPPIFMLLMIPFNNKGGLYKKMSYPSSVLILSILILIVDYVTTQSVHDDFCCFLILGLLSYFCFPKIDNDVYFDIFSFMFVIVSVILSLELLFAGNQFVESYGNTDISRVVWADPNYLGGVIGMGAITSVVLLIRYKSTIIKIGVSIALMIIVMALVKNSSRGALLAAICGVSLILMGRGFKIWQKIIIIAIAVGFIVLLYNNGYFELLAYRLDNDTGGGSGRSGIWEKKLAVYFNDSSVFQMIFGRGYDNGIAAGFSYKKAFHNDFIAFLVEYGLIGFMAFVYMLIYPMKCTHLKDSIVLGGTAFLMINCMTLEPFTLGMSIYYFFWLYIFMYANMYRRKHLFNICKRPKMTYCRD